MDASSLIGQDSYVTGLQKQAAAQTGALKSLGAKAANMKQVHDAAQKFESFFVGQMMEHMTSGIETDETFGGGHGEDMWKSQLNQEYGKEIAKSGKLGITDQVMKGMLKMQEQRTAAAQAAAGQITLDPTTVAPAAQTDSATDEATSGQALAQQDAAIAMVAGSRLPVRR